MNEMTREPDLATVQKIRIVDCDIHPAMASRDELTKFMPARWRDHARDFGIRTASPTHGAMPYPRISPGNGMRRDAWPPNGGPPASDVAFLQEQLLDALGIDYGILQALGAGGATFNQGLGAAISSAIATASSSVSNGITTTTGPKISSRAMRIVLSTPVYTVGST